MDKMVAIEMLMDKTMADELIEKGLAEIALRRVDAKFRAMIKCPILGTPVAGEAVPGKLISAAQDLMAQNTESLANVRKLLHSLETGTGMLASCTKDIAMQVDGLYQLSNAVLNISYLNTGLSLANTAVDIAGFAIVTEKLNALNCEVQKLADNVSQVANVQKNEKIGQCEKLIMLCNSMAVKVNDNDEINIVEMENLLIDLKTFISEMLRNLHDESMDEEALLKMIYTLVPAYTFLLNDFIKSYYFLKKSTSPNYKTFMSLYDELEKMSFMVRMEDHYFLKKGLYSHQVVDIMNAHRLLGINAKTQIEDQFTILQALETKSNILDFEAYLDKIARKRMEDSIPVLAAGSGVDEEQCRKVFLGE